MTGEGATTPIDPLVDPTARTVYEAFEQLGWELDPHKIIRKIRQLQLGLPAEDEFVALMSWLGKCQLIHKLDQEQYPPGSREHYQVPDLFAIFSVEGQSVPVLIEVKVTTKGKLSWTPEYLGRLRRYSQEAGFPLLVAWLHRPSGHWKLFDSVHFAKSRQNYHADLSVAMIENLMGLLAGDAIVIPREGVGIHYRMFCLGTIAERKQTGQRICRVDEVFFTDGDGRKIDRLGPGMWSLLTCLDLEPKWTDITDAETLLSWQVPVSNSGEFLHRMFPFLLSMQSEVGKDHLHWRQVLKSEFPVTSDQLLGAAQNGEMIQSIVRLVPATFPSFLPGTVRLE